MADRGSPDLGVAEAAAAYGTSVSTIRRLLTAGKLPGARRVPGPKGAEYRIPAAAMEALGYSPVPGGPATVRTAQAESELERLTHELEQAQAELERLRIDAHHSDERARLLAASVGDLRSGPSANAGERAGGRVAVLGLVVTAALIAVVALALTRAGGHEVNLDVATAPPAAPAVTPLTIAPSPTTLPAATNAPPTTSVPSTSSASTTTRIAAPPRVPATPPQNDGLAEARDRYREITGEVNPTLAELAVAYDRLTAATVRDVCALLANTYRHLYLALDATAWPSEVRSSMGTLVRAAAALEAELRSCARARPGSLALERARSPEMGALEEAVGLAATKARLALGLPATEGFVLPDRQL